MTRKIVRPDYSQFSQRDIATAIFNGNVYVRVVSVSSSGMSRQMQFSIVHKNRIVDITEEIVSLYGSKTNKNGYLSVGGCGMDMCFHALYTALYGRVAYCTGLGKKTIMTPSKWGQRYNTL